MMYAKAFSVLVGISSSYNCRQTLQRTMSNICHAGQYTIIEYTQRIHIVQHGNVSSHIGALLLKAVQTETTIKHTHIVLQKTHNFPKASLTFCH